jgi:hypothetical protein
MFSSCTLTIKFQIVSLKVSSSFKRCVPVVDDPSDVEVGDPLEVGVQQQQQHKRRQHPHEQKQTHPKGKT